MINIKMTLGRTVRRVAWGLVAVLGFALVGCGGGDETASAAPPSSGTPGGCPPSGGGSGQAKWTYLVYMAADNTLSDMAGYNVAQMKKACSSADVRVVVQVEQSQQYTTGGSNETLRGTVSNGNVQLTSIGQVNMSDKQSLSNFIKWGKRNYPADRYAVVLWSHGGGWKIDKTARGALQDLSESTALMSIKDIAWALMDAGGVDMVNFDACLMAMYEVAYELRNAAKVLVGSEEVIPGTGNPYDLVINRMVANPTQDAATLARGIVDDFYSYYVAKNHDAIVISAIDLTRMDALHAEIQKSAAVFLSNLNSERIHIEAARVASASYAYPNNHDLAHFATELAQRTGSAAVKAQASALATAAKTAILANKVLALQETKLVGSTGLAIYLPSKDATPPSELSGYRTAASSNIAANTAKSWSDFVEPLVNGTAGGSAPVDSSGAFAYGIAWDNPDVDLDLLINEPQGNWVGPVIGATSTNSYSSPDSYDSGESSETYTANGQLEKGGYDVFVNYAGCHQGVASCGSTTVRVFRYDPSNGDTAAVEISRRVMSATPALNISFDPWDTFVAAVRSNTYGDWLYAQQTTRSLSTSVKVVAAQPKRPAKGWTGQVHK